MPGMFDPANVEWPTVGRYAIGGGLAGSSAASLLALLNMLQQASAEKKKEQARHGTGEDTIVLTLPRTKTAADLSEPPDTKAPKVCTKPTCSCTTNKLTAKGQVRHFDGEFGTGPVGSIKKANWQTLVMAMLAAMGAGGAGYSLVDKVYSNRRLSKKQQEADQARQEYLDVLEPKTAQVKPGGNRRSFNTVDYPLAFAMLSLILGGGATAYMTKRILDEYSTDAARQTKDPMAPQVKRIVFKTAEADIDPDTASEKIAALVGIYLDICSGKPEILGDSKCATELTRLGLDAAAMYKAAAYAEDYAGLLATLEANPELRQLIQRVAAERHPVLRHAKWLLKMPGVRGQADKQLYAKLEQALGPAQSPPPSESTVAKVAAGLPMMLGGGVPGMLGASIIGSEIAETSAERGRSKAMHQAKIDKVETPDQHAKRVLAGLTVATADHNADEFVRANAADIKKLLKELALQGSI
jgi:hypothetical protein